MPVKRYNGTDWVTVAGDGGQGPAGNDGTAPLSTKGDLLTRTTSAVTNLGVGANNTVLTADSTTATGLKWADGSGMTLISTTTLSGASTTISNLPNGYKELYFFAWGLQNETSTGAFRLALNNSTTSFYGTRMDNTTASAINGGYITGGTYSRLNADNFVSIRVGQVDNALTSMRPVDVTGLYYNGSAHVGYTINGGFYVISGGPITSAVFSQSGGNWLTGTVKVYGVN